VRIQQKAVIARPEAAAISRRSTGLFSQGGWEDGRMKIWEFGFGISDLKTVGDGPSKDFQRLDHSIT
jgi:hypothetical protein